MKCSQLPHSIAKTLDNQTVTIKEISSGIIFNAFVEDYCCEDQKGIIVTLDKDLKQVLHHTKFYEVDYKEDKMGLDLRDIHEGQYFEILQLTFH